MARLVLNVSLVNGSAFAKREIGAHELAMALVGDDIRPPARGIYLTLYTDDNKRVEIGVDPKGYDLSATTFRDESGPSPDVEPAVMPPIQRDKLLGVLGTPTKSYLNTDEWECGCRCQSLTPVGYPPSDDDLTAWVPCGQHRTHRL